MRVVSTRGRGSPRGGQDRAPRRWPMGLVSWPLKGELKGRVKGGKGACVDSAREPAPPLGGVVVVGPRDEPNPRSTSVHHSEAAAGAATILKTSAKRAL